VEPGAPSARCAQRLSSFLALFARQISVVPEPSVPVLTVIAVIAGTLATANLVAAIPGRTAARTSAAALLRAE
jgi:hypothetical protein